MLDQSAGKGRGAVGAKLLHVVTRSVRQSGGKLAWIVRNEGVAGAAHRLRAKLSSALRPPGGQRIVRDQDLLGADLEHPPARKAARPVPGETITLNWIMTAPNAGSGGHTTIFRIIQHLEANGYRSRVYFYDARLTSYDQYETALREYYDFHGPVGRFDAGMEDAHGVVATSWPTAYASYCASSAGKRLYFVQDYEPDFYPVSTDRILADNTYRMGFHAITAGRWLAQKLRTEFAMDADSFEFGCDTASYANRGTPRTGIAFYARPGTPRRGFELGILALQLFAARRPDIDIHLYGERVGKLPFRAVSHGLVNQHQLNNLYNRCFAGLSLSLTNVSLVPLEMLASGCIPVLNDAPHNRLVIDNPFVRYAAATPQALAGSLEDIVAMPEFAAYSRAASDSQQGVHWKSAGEDVDRAIRAVLQT